MRITNMEGSAAFLRTISCNREAMKEEHPLNLIFDLGHRGEVDYTQIALFQKLTPTERLRLHEGWRLFVKEALARLQVHEPPARS